MEFKYMMVFLLEATFTFTIIICSRIVVDDSLSTKESLEFYVKDSFQKSGAIKSIQSEDGDIIDCIDIYKQPAFDHPALRDHKIQLKPSYDVKMETPANEETSRRSPVTVTTQTWHKSGSCPKGTIPIRRIQNNNVSKGHSDSNYGRKKPMFSDYNTQLKDSNTSNLLRNNYSLAILHTEGFAYFGGKGDMKVWNPRVESDDEYTTSRVALKNGPYYDFEALESGWQVNPLVYGDRKTRLFTYWTVDGSQKTGCFDLTCPGFVQTSHEIALGGAIYPISDPTGLPYQITIYIHKDPATSNWWVQYGDTINIGYWPEKLFSVLRFHADTVQWGGEVHSSRVGTHHPHTATAMGSGEFPDFVMQSSGYMKRMRVLRNNLVLRIPEWTYMLADEFSCYEVYHHSDYVPEPEFYFGGPGSYRNPFCR